MSQSRQHNDNEIDESENDIDESENEFDESENDNVNENELNRDVDGDEYHSVHDDTDAGRQRYLLQRRPSKEKQLWQSIFACSSNGNEQDLQQALQLLSRESVLAQIPFKEVDQGGFLVKRLFPLHSLVIVIPRLKAKMPNTNIDSSAILSILQKVHDLHKSAIQMELVYNGFRGTPLDYACSHYGGTDPCLLQVVEWLAVTYPRALVTPNHVGLFPIHRAFQSKQTLEQAQWPTHELFQILIQKAPHTMLQRDRHPYYHMNPLEWAFHLEYDVQTQEYLIQQYLEQLRVHHRSNTAQLLQLAAVDDDKNDFRLDVSVGDDQGFDAQQASMVAKVLPHIQGRMDVICSKKLCVEGFTNLLIQYLATNTTVTKLSFFKISNEYINYYVGVWNALQLFLANNTTVQELILSARRHVYGAEVSNDQEEEEKSHDMNDGTLMHHRPSLLKSIAEGIHNNRGSLTTLVLQQIEIPNQRIFCSLVNENVLLRKLVLENIRMNFLWNQGNASEGVDGTLGEDMRNSNNPSKTLEELIVIAMADQSNAKSIMDGLLNHLSMFPVLKKVGLVVHAETSNSHATQNDMLPSKKDITTPVAALIEQNRLEHLTVAASQRKSVPRRRRHPSAADDSASTREIGPLSIDLSRLCHTSLTTNTSLRSFDCYVMPVTASENDAMEYSALTHLLTTLEHHNCTLTRVPLTNWDIPQVQATYDSCGSDTIIEKISYWLQLNQHGRSTARDASTSLDAFVDLLCAQINNEYQNWYQPYVYAAPEEEEEYGSITHCKLDLFNVVYGLLRELPATWSC